MPYRRTPAVQARLDAQRAAILRAGADVLADHGYAACTVAAVAARAGVATGTVYNHVDSKAQLAAELFRALVSRELAAVRDAVGDAGDAADRLTRVVETFAGRAQKHPRRAYALLAEPVVPAVEALRLEFRTAFRDLIADAIADGVRRGSLPPQDATVVAAALVGAIAEALIGPLAAGMPDPATVPTLLEFVHRAVGARDPIDTGGLPSCPPTR
ncbi:TetR/AcrR family transcriptional regulator [Jatrophihabitans fulvus]